MNFNYEEAFSRNLGWVTVEEQALLRKKKVAIAGLGGVGGIHLVTLSRLGISNFHIADFDQFELPNFNRQAGASVSTLGMEKSEVMKKQALDINPDSQITLFKEGVTEKNIDAFLEGVDIYVDSVDFFAFEARELLFRKCYEKGIPAITAGPLGMSSAVMSFLPGKMSFEDYFQWEGQSNDQKALRFMMGLSPRGIHMKYLVDRTRVNFKEGRGPSTGMACQMCAGIAGVEVLKILLGRGKVYCAPWSYQFDAYTTRLVKTWRPCGNRNPLQRLLLALAAIHLKRNS